MEYREAKETLISMKDIKVSTVSYEIDDALSRIRELNDSRRSFDLAKKYEEEDKDYINAFIKYNKVIKEDENYEKAQKKIDEFTEPYQNQVLDEVQDYIGNKKYDKALDMLEQASDLFPEDKKFYDELENVQKQKEEAAIKKIEKLKEEQLVIVENVRIMIQSSDHKALYPDMLQATVKNNSEKTVKNMEVGFLGYDKNGYPVKISASWGIYENYEFVGTVEGINITPGEKFGHNQGWELDDPHGISKPLACVKYVTFYDGSTWENPYYDYWIDKHKKKPLENK